MSMRESAARRRYHETITSRGLTEFYITISIHGRVGDKHPGWAQNNVEAVVPKALEKAGIMVDACTVKVVSNPGVHVPPVWERGEPNGQ